MLEIQSEALAAREEGVQQPTRAATKGKRKAPPSDADESDSSNDEIMTEDDDDDEAGEPMVQDEDGAPVPMPESGGIQALRDKLHARMAQLRNKGKEGWADSGYGGKLGGRDELLEERRQQRAAMRERRRKETREKIEREKERKGKGKGDKGKAKEQEKQKGTQTKVRVLFFMLCMGRSFVRCADPIACARRHDGHLLRTWPQVHLRHFLSTRLRLRVVRAQTQKEPPNDRVQSYSSALAAHRAQGEARSTTRTGARGAGGAREVGEGERACGRCEGAR